MPKACPIVYYAIVRVREGEEDEGREGRGRKEWIKEGKDGDGEKIRKRGGERGRERKEGGRSGGAREMLFSK